MLKKDNTLTFFDCFAGAGGFRLALTMAGIKCVGYCEIDKHAAFLYKNYFNTEGIYFEEDAINIKTEALPEFDILTGGFPCQSFSVIGKRQGFKNPRGTLFFELVRILKHKRPRHFIFENVKGLLAHDSGKTFQSIITVLAELGYSVEWQVLNTRYFGLPQNRERVFIIGCLGRESGGKIFPIKQSTWSDSRKFSSTAIDANYWKGVDNHGQRTMISIQSETGNRIRKLTPLECFRLQGFPDDIVKKAYKIGISDTQLYKMAGNAVSVPVVYEIAKKIIIKGK